MEGLWIGRDIICGMKTERERWEDMDKIQEKEEDESVQYEVCDRCGVRHGVIEYPDDSECCENCGYLKVTDEDKCYCKLDEDAERIFTQHCCDCYKKR